MSEGHPVILTENAARKFLYDLRKVAGLHRCCHGHACCSTYGGGPCLEETLNNFPEVGCGGGPPGDCYNR